MHVKIRSAALALATIVGLTGCVSTATVAVDRSTLAGFRGATITLSQRERPTFIANTAGKAMFGVLGVAAMAHAGNEVVRENGVPDPSVSIAHSLATDLASDDALRVLPSETTTTSTDVAQLAKQYVAADLLLDVQTVNWSWVYFPTDWSHYRVVYSVKMRLIDTRHSKLIADGFCARQTEKTPEEAPTKDELLRDHAAGLKRILAAAGDYCVREFRTRVFKKS